MFLLYLRSVVLFENWREVAVAVLLNMPSRLQRDVGLAPAFTRMCRRRRPLPSWCFKVSILQWPSRRRCGLRRIPLRALRRRPVLQTFQQ